MKDNLLNDLLIFLSLIIVLFVNEKKLSFKYIHV